MLRVRKHREGSPGPCFPPLEEGEEEEEEEEVSTGDEDCAAGDRAGYAPPRSAAAPRRGRRRRGGKRPRLPWTPEMHADFLEAVDKLGGPWTATPKAILDCMAHPEHLTLTNIKSKIQKHRLRSSREARADRQRATAAQAGLLAALGGALPGLGGSAASLAGGGGQLGNSGTLKGCGSRGPALACVDTVCQPGMVPVTTVSPGPVAALPSLLCNTLAPRGPPAGVSTNQMTAATAALAAGRQQPELPFEDGTLGVQAAACRRRQQQALGAMAATLQQAQRQQAAAGSGGVCCAAGPGHPALQAVPARLLRLQLDNAQCVKQLHGLHMLQMQHHLEGAARLKALAAGQGLRWSEADRIGPAGASGADAVREGGLQKQEPSQQQTGNAAGGKLDEQGPASGPARQAAAPPPGPPMLLTLTSGRHDDQQSAAGLPSGWRGGGQ